MRYFKIMLIALALLASFKSACAVEGKLFWPIPWERTPVLNYQVTSETVKENAGKKQISKTSYVSTLKTRKQEADAGYLQEWSDSDSTLEHEGYTPEELADVKALLKSLQGLKAEVALDKDGGYLRIDNIDSISRILRAALEKTFLDNSGQQAKISPDKAVEIKAMQANILDMFTKKEALENLVSRLPLSFHFFAGGGLDPTTAYEVDEVGANPFGGKSFPMKTHMEINLDEEDPGFVTAIWIVNIDPEKGAEAVLEITEKMLGSKIEAAEKEKMSKQIEITNRVDYRIELATGIVQQMTRVETKKIMGRIETKTTTMNVKQ